MRQIFALSTIACSLFFATACKKTAVTDAPKPADPFGQQISLTVEEADRLRTMLWEGPIKSPANFMEKLKELRSSGKINHVQVQTTYPIDQYYPSSEDMVDGSWVSGLPSSSQSVSVPPSIYYGFDLDVRNTLRSFQTTFAERQVFAVRHNEILVEVPYIATVKWGLPNNFQIAAVSAAPLARVQLLPVGSHWGQVTQSPYNNYINFGGATPVFDAHGEAQEERTAITATQGKIKISNNVDLELWKVGTDVEVGFTISKAENIYNQYTMNGTVRVEADGAYSQYNNAIINTYAMIHCTDIGILLND
jgi:hypothetical protein